MGFGGMESAVPQPVGSSDDGMHHMSKLVGQILLACLRGNTHGEGRNENAKDKTTAGLQRSEKLRLFDMQRTRVLAIKRSFLLSQAQV